MTNLARAARAQKWPPRPRAEKFLAPRQHPDCARILAKGPIFFGHTLAPAPVSFASARAVCFPCVVLPANIHTHTTFSYNVSVSIGDMIAPPRNTRPWYVRWLPQSAPVPAPAPPPPPPPPRMAVIARACTRPCRVAYSLCHLPFLLLVICGFLGIIVWDVSEPLAKVHRTWLLATCTYASNMSISVVKHKNSKQYRISAPVSLRDDASGASWDGLVAHRWPSTNIMDSDVAALYDWWTSAQIGGTGEVLVPPSEGWFGSEGRFLFGTRLGATVACWYLPAAVSTNAPRAVKLSNEAVSTWSYWLFLVLFLPCVLAAGGGACALAIQAGEECKSEMDKIERRERGQPPALQRTKSRIAQLMGARAITRQNSHYDVREEERYAGSHSAVIRNGFLRKVFGIVTMQMVLTALVVVLFMYFEPLAAWVHSPCVVLYYGGPQVIAMVCLDHLIRRTNVTDCGAVPRRMLCLMTRSSVARGLCTASTSP